MEILLVTSRGTKRWIIPKGWPMSGRKPSKAAAQEAYEEAGLRGDIGGKTIGTYRYEKYLDEEGRTVPCDVKVFPLKVRRQLKAWPEEEQRLTQWFPADEAARLVHEEGLADLIQAFDTKMQQRLKRATPAKVASEAV